MSTGDSETPTLTPDEQVGRLFRALSSDPRYRKRVLGLIKEASPETPMPELDLQDTLSKDLDEKLKPSSDSIKKMQETISQLQRTLARRQWQEKTNLSDEELVEVEELAKTKGIVNGETAVDYWRKSQPLGTPRSSRMPAADEEYLKKLTVVNPRDQRTIQRLVLEEAERVLSSARKGR